MKRWQKWCIVVAAALLMGIVLRQYAYTMRIVGTSMEGELRTDDIVWITRSYAAPKRGDVMLCRFPNADCVKRVIGLPNETVEMRGGEVYIDGGRLYEPYATLDSCEYRVELGADEYLVLGDNRAQSYDSRETDVGVLRKEDFLGNVRCVILPFSRIHTVNKEGAWKNMDNEEMRENAGNQAEQTEEQTEQQKKQERSKRFWKEVREWVVSLAVALVIVFVVRTFLFTIIRVDGGSMQHTLEDGERLFVSVLDVRMGDIDRDDVVICHYPNRYTSYLFGLIKTKTYFVKRVVAGPGDVVYRRFGVTYVEYKDENGETVTEALDAKKESLFYVGSDYEPYTLGENEYFVVGDNRYNSHDSRDWNDSDPSSDVGPITEDMIVGHVRSVIWPLGVIRTVE